MNLNEILAKYELTEDGWVSCTLCPVRWRPSYMGYGLTELFCELIKHTHKQDDSH
jgi:hypothetical protein